MILTKININNKIYFSVDENRLVEIIVTTSQLYGEFDKVDFNVDEMHLHAGESYNVVISGTYQMCMGVSFRDGYLYTKSEDGKEIPLFISEGFSRRVEIAIYNSKRLFFKKKCHE